MAKLTLSLGSLKPAELEVSDAGATKVLSAVWEVNNAGVEATKQEKLDWIVKTFLQDALTNEASKKTVMEVREQEKALREQQRELRELHRAAREEKIKFE